MTAAHSLEDNISEQLRQIAAIGADPKGGWTRLAFSGEEDAAHSYASLVLRQLGFSVTTDAFMNTIARFSPPGTSATEPAIMLGTHLDTVKNGGNYDGVVGFIVAVEAVRECINNEVGLPGMVIAIFRAEESTLFKKACLGSRAAFLGLDEDALQLSYEDSGGLMVTLGECAERAGGISSKLTKPLQNVRNVRAYFETHIEQARVLERMIGLDRADKDSPDPLIGIVTSIRAPHRCEWEVSGPNSATIFARCVIAVEACALLANQFGFDAVATVGRVDQFVEGADKINAVPGHVLFPVAEFCEQRLLAACEIAARRGCRVRKIEESGGLRVEVIGMTDHSGGTPMGRESRRDALVAACEILATLEEMELVSSTRIVFATDVRSNCARQRDFVSSLIAALFDRIENVSQVCSEQVSTVEKLRRTERSEPVDRLNSELQEMIASAASKEHLRYHRLASGAGHDAMMAAVAGIPTAMLFIPSIDGLSHNPSESSRVKDIAAAVRVQARILSQYAQPLNDASRRQSR